MSQQITVTGIEGIPEINSGDDLPAMIIEAALKQDLGIRDGDVLVVTQKVVSKAEGRVITVDELEPSVIAVQLSEGHNRDARHTEAILRESRRIVRMDRGNIIAETRHGFICANAGIDASNVPGEETVAMLPIDPDASARQIRQAALDRAGVDVAVIISDTFGRPWREGAANVAIGVAGMDPVKDYRGLPDEHGLMMRTTVIAVADELAAAAELATGKTLGIPVTLIRGYRYDPELPERSGASALVRAPEKDMFR